MAYVVVGWLALQVSDVLVEALELPLVWSKALIALLTIGFIPMLAFSWVYEMTPEGLRKESEIQRDESITHHTARKLDLVVIMLLVVALVMFGVDRFTGTEDVVPIAESGPDIQSAEVTQYEVKTVPIVAVLPLKTMSTGEEGTFLAAGLHDDLLTKLAKLRAFKVISRTSVMEYVDTTRNIRQIGGELGAGFIVEGGLQAIGGRVSINAQLIDAATDEHLWAETFNRELTTANLFDVQNEIATAISNAMHATLSPREVRLLAEVPTEDLDAYRAYLRGLEHAENLTQPSLRAAVDAFSEAVTLDPEFAGAWARLGRAYLRRYWEEGGEIDADPDKSLIESARKALDRAKYLAPDNVEVLLSEAYYYYYGYRDYSAALVELEKAEAIAPYDHMVIASRGFLLRRLGRMDEAADALLKSREYNPAHLGHIREGTNTLFDAGRCDEARQLAAEGLERYPDEGGILMAVSFTYLVCQGDIDAAHSLIKSVVVTTTFEFQTKLDMLIYTGDAEGAIDHALSEQLQFADDTLMQLSIANSLTALYELTGNEEQAEESRYRASDLAAELDRKGAFALRQLAFEAAMRGDKELTVKLSKRSLEAFPTDALVKPVFQYRNLMVLVLAGAEQAAWQAFQDWLPVALYSELQLLRYNPFLEPLRADPRFEAVHTAALQRFAR
jgi:TolB-like protein